MLLYNEFIYKELLPEIKVAMEEAIRTGRTYQSSQLLPVYIKWGGKDYGPYIELYLKNTEPNRPSPSLNIVRSLEYLSREQSEFLLPKLMGCQDELVMEELHRLGFV